MDFATSASVGLTCVVPERSTIRWHWLIAPELVQLRRLFDLAKNVKRLPSADSAAIVLAGFLANLKPDLFVLADLGCGRLLRCLRSRLAVRLLDS